MKVQISPLGSMELLAQLEVDMLKHSANSELYQLFRNCSLATLNAGTKTDNTKELLDKYQDYDINVISRERGIKLELINPPKSAFVDNTIIRSIRANLFAVLRDILFVNNQLSVIKKLLPAQSDNRLTTSFYMTNFVFSILRNANALHLGEDPNLIVCWGGHSINETEYYYARQVGMQLGLRELNICTGCGPGVMEAPMKGAAVGHAQQRYKQSRFIGMTEPSIIAAEPPNALVNELIIMPDIEKRLEAFVRMAHGIIIFPGGPGTAEELLYILGIMLDPANKDQVLPLILTGPKESEAYFIAIDNFIRNALGEEATKLYEIVIGDPEKVARTMKKGVKTVKNYRLTTGDAYSYNWLLKIDEALQFPFDPSHKNMSELNLHKNQSVDLLAADLRRAFSGIVAGNVKESGMQAIAQHGRYQLQGDIKIMQELDRLLANFVADHRMKLPGGTAYVPCYEIKY